MDRIPLAPYDFFGYLGSGLALLAGMQLAFGFPPVLGRNLSNHAIITARFRASLKQYAAPFPLEVAGLAYRLQPVKPLFDTPVATGRGILYSAIVPLGYPMKGGTLAL